MIHRIVTVLAVTSLIVLGSTTIAEAGRGRSRLIAPRRHHVRTSHTVTRKATYSRVRQIDGRSLWDLGKQNGEWPQLRF